MTPSSFTTSEGRRFGLTVGSAFLVVAAVSRWRGHATPPTVLALAGVALIVAGLVIPARLGSVYRAWIGLSHLLSRITTPIAMGIVYFLVLTPTGLLIGISGKHPLRGPPPPR